MVWPCRQVLHSPLLIRSLHFDRINTVGLHRLPRCHHEGSSQQSHSWWQTRFYRALHRACTVEVVQHILCHRPWQEVPLPLGPHTQEKIDAKPDLMHWIRMHAPNPFKLFIDAFQQIHFDVYKPSKNCLRQRNTPSQQHLTPRARLQPLCGLH